VVHAPDTPETVDGVVERVTELPGENGVETTVEAVEVAPSTSCASAADVTRPPGRSSSGTAHGR
jgi:hypothetical protein